MATTTIKFLDRQGNRDRQTRLLVIPAEGPVYWFAGGSDSAVTVTGKQYTKDGKWSHTTWDLEVSDGVRTLVVRQGWESGKWREGFCDALGLPSAAKWDAVATTLGRPVEQFVDLAAGKVVIPVGPPAVEKEVD
jgi:hypothetical protein